MHFRPDQMIDFRSLDFLPSRTDWSRSETAKETRYVSISTPRANPTALLSRQMRFGTIPCSEINLRVPATLGSPKRILSQRNLF